MVKKETISVSRSSLVKNKVLRNALYRKEKMRKLKEKRERRNKKRKEREELGDKVSYYVILYILFYRDLSVLF